MSAQGLIGLAIGLVTACLLLAWSLVHIVKTGDGLAVAPVFLFSVVSVHFLARIGARRQRRYVQRWRRVILFVCVAGPLAVALGGLVFGGLGVPRLLLFGAVVAASAGMWVALTDRLKPNGERGAV
jgi:hypothetical protein